MNVDKKPRAKDYQLKFKPKEINQAYKKFYGQDSSNPHKVRIKKGLHRKIQKIQGKDKSSDASRSPEKSDMQLPSEDEVVLREP